jgi:transcriptional regulator with XRE-family HTH domain
MKADKEAGLATGRVACARRRGVVVWRASPLPGVPGDTPMQTVEPTSFGDLLRQFRLAVGLTQEALAERAGLSVHGVQKLERGVTHPYPDTVKRLTVALQLPPDVQVPFNAAALPAARPRQARPQPAGASSPQSRAIAGLLVMGHASRTALVGRRRELSLLTERLATAREGRGGLVLVAGEPGIGKTRLMVELAQRAHSEGWQVLSGRSYDSEGMPPYFPVAEALRAYVRACRSKELRTRLGRSAADVALVVTEVRDRLPDTPPAPAGIDDYGRYRVFESVSEFVLAIARSTPGAGLLLCLDDLHWGDQSTLLLLKYLAQKAASAPLLMVGAYRTTELTRTHALADVLADLRRDELSERVLLTSLSAEDTTALIDGLAGAPASRAVADAIYRETDGHPFFIAEVVRQLQADGRDLTDVRAATMQWGIPEGVREVIGRRLSRLRTASNQLLQAAAVLGENLTVDVLEAVSGLDGNTLMDALDDAVGAGMLREEGASHAFTHALIRETLYDELSLARKQRLHRQAGDALMHAHVRNLRPLISTIAAHYRLAGPAAESDAALDWARRAGEAAAAVYAWKEAADHWQAALQLVGPDDTEMRCDLLLELGKILLPAGQPRRVVDEIAPEAVLLAESLGDHQRVLRASLLALEGLGTSGAAGAFYTAEGRSWAERANR